MCTHASATLADTPVDAGASRGYIYYILLHVVMLYVTCM